MSEPTADERDIAEQESTSQETTDAPVDNVRSIDEAKKKVTAAVGEARDRFQHVAADVSDRFQQASATAQEELRDRSARARHQARERYQAASAQMQEGYTKVRQDVEYKVGDVNDFVRQKPGVAVLIAAAAGFLLGLLFRPRPYND